jgi:Rrf2 family transcriptional regulator, nitric oxide-sensitive transcriptional repressor
MISQTVEYGLRALVLLASRGSAPATTKEISESARVPTGYLSKVMQGLAKAGLVRSQRGLGGGHVLARPPQDITILDAVNAIDPIKRIATCPLGLAAHGTELCPLHRRLDDAYASVEAAFAGSTLADLVESPEGYVQFYEMSESDKDTP